MTSGPIRCIIVDDHEIVAEGVAARLRSLDGVEVVGKAADGDAGLELILKEEPDVALVDYRLPGKDGLELVELAVRRCRTRHILFSAAISKSLVDRAFMAGAHGYISKLSPTFTIDFAIRTVAAGGHYVDPTIAADILRPTDALSDREEEVLMLLGEGLSNKQIADRLGLKSETVKTHVARVMHKLEATNRTEVVIKAFRSSLLH